MMRTSFAKAFLEASYVQSSTVSRRVHTHLYRAFANARSCLFNTSRSVDQNPSIPALRWPLAIPEHCPSGCFGTSQRAKTARPCYTSKSEVSQVSHHTSRWRRKTASLFSATRTEMPSTDTERPRTTLNSKIGNANIMPLGSRL